VASRNKTHRSRTVQNAGTRSTRVRNARPKEIDGINFRSLLEAFCYRKLKEAGIKNDYEKHKFVLLEGFHYPEQRLEDNGKTGYKDKKTHKVRDITYTPDFVDPQGRWIIECKGYANERFPLKWKMFMKQMAEKDNPPALFVPRNQNQVLTTIEAILELMAPTK
jgi:hypothetical protein